LILILEKRLHPDLERDNHQSQGGYNLRKADGLEIKTIKTPSGLSGAAMPVSQSGKMAD